MFSKLFFCLIFLTALTPLYSQEPLAQQLKSIIENKKATVGIAVLYNGKILVTVNDKAGYPMMSTFKFPLALAVLERLDKQGLPLETELFISKPDLHPDTYSPLREARPEGNFKITIGELLKYSVALSDNNACDILIDYLGKSDISSRRQIYGISIENSGWMRAVRTCTVALVADGDTVFGCRENFAGDGYRVFRFIDLIGFQDGKRIFFQMRIDLCFY